MNPKWIVTARLFLGTKVPPHFFLTEMSDTFFTTKSFFYRKVGFYTAKAEIFFYGKADIFYSKAEFFLQFFFIVISM